MEVFFTGHCLGLRGREERGKKQELVKSAPEVVNG